MAKTARPSKTVQSGKAERSGRTVRPSNTERPSSTERPLEVSIPDRSTKVAWRRVGLFTVLGLCVGIAWPLLAGLRVGPHVPGAKRPKKAAKPTSSLPATKPSAAALANPSATASSMAKGAAAAKPDNAQTVVVAGGVIMSCQRGKKRLEGSECGALRIDRLLAPRLRELSGCPSALGLKGDLELRFDIRFDKKEIRVLRGRKGELPSTTVAGILACVGDYISDVSADKLPHTYARYKVSYGIKFYPPGAAPKPDSDADAKADADAEGAQEKRSVATVSWDSALVRDEPRSGKVVARLVRGTRVKILGRRKDWYRVRIRSQEGWIYRAALGQ